MYVYVCVCVCVCGKKSRNEAILRVILLIKSNIPTVNMTRPFFFAKISLYFLILLKWYEILCSTSNRF